MVRIMEKIKYGAVIVNGGGPSLVRLSLQGRLYYSMNIDLVSVGCWTLAPIYHCLFHKKPFPADFHFCDAT